MADDAKNKIKLIDGIIKADEIDVNRPQYQNWNIQEFTNKFPNGFSESRRGTYFNVANEVEASLILNAFRNKCKVVDYGDEMREVITRVYFWHK